MLTIFLFLISSKTFKRILSFCSCGLSIELTSHFLLHCPIFHGKRHTLQSTLNNIDCKILEPTDSYLTQTLLFGCTSFDSETNTLVLNATIDYIFSAQRFKEPLFQEKSLFFKCNFQNFHYFIIFICQIFSAVDCHFLVFCVLYIYILNQHLYIHVYI